MASTVRPQPPETDDAAVIVAHGERGGRRDNALLTAIAGDVARALAPLPILPAVLSGEPSLEAACERLRNARRVILYPLFLSAGYFSETALKGRWAEAGAATGTSADVQQLPPLGLDPALPDLVARMAGRAAPDGPGTLILGAHGSSKSDAAREANEAVADRLRAFGGFSRILTGYLEEPPYLRDTLSRAPPGALLMGMFTGLGLHGEDDMADLVAAAPSEIVVLGNVGQSPDLPDLITAAIRTALTDPQAAG